MYILRRFQKVLVLCALFLLMPAKRMVYSFQNANGFFLDRAWSIDEGQLGLGKFRRF